MKEYEKIETFYTFDSKTRKFTYGIYNKGIDFIRKLPCVATEKIDGTNIRIHWDGHRVEWAGRTDKSEIPIEVQAVLHILFDDAEVIFEQNFGEKEVYLNCEAFGGKIQGGKYGGNERLILFDVCVDGKYLDRGDLFRVAGLFSLDVVRSLYFDDWFEAVKYVYDIKNNPQAHISCECDNGTTVEEGLVVRPLVQLYDENGNRLQAKMKVRDFERMD